MSFTSDQEQSQDPPVDIRAVLNEATAGRVESGRIAQLSDPTREQVREFIAAWEEVPVQSRRELIRSMLQQGQDNLALDFSRYFKVALDDEDPEVRALSVQGLWEDTSLNFLEKLCARAEVEPEAAVQEAIAVALGKFAYQIEMGELDAGYSASTQRALFHLLNHGRNWMVRRRALESSAFMTQNEQVKDAIAEWAESDFEQERAGAVIAMGRNLDPRWFSIIMSELGNEDPDIRCESARAAGQFSDTAAIDRLARLVDDEDPEIRQVAIESIGHIGGNQAVDMLRYLEKQVPDDMREVVEEAIEEARFLSEPTGLEE